MPSALSVFIVWEQERARGPRRCTSNCFCYNCENSYGKIQKNSKPITPPKRRQREHRSNFKRQKGKEYLQNMGYNTIEGPWTDIERVVLQTVESFISVTSVPPTEENICTLYNYVIETTHAKLNQVCARVKTLSQIKGKLSYEKKRQCSELQLYQSP